MGERTSALILFLGGVFTVFAQEQFILMNSANDEMSRLEQLEYAIQDLSRGSSWYPIWAINEMAVGILMNLASLQVRLISHRGGPQGQLVDKTLSKIEDKSYQLKTMLIQLQQDKTTPVTYFPDQAKAGGYGMNPVYRPPMNIAYRG